MLIYLLAGKYFRSPSPSIMYTDASLPGEGIVLDRLYQRVQCLIDALCQPPSDVVPLFPSLTFLDYDLLCSNVGRFRASVDLVTQPSPYEKTIFHEVSPHHCAQAPLGTKRGRRGFPIVI